MQDPTEGLYWQKRQNISHGTLDVFTCTLAKLTTHFQQTTSLRSMNLLYSLYSANDSFSAT